MKNFLKNNINWKRFIVNEIVLTLFALFSYFVGNNKFPHNFFLVPLIVVVIGIWVILNAYYEHQIKNNKKEN